jgi:hypothetical protein
MNSSIALRITLGLIAFLSLAAGEEQANSIIDVASDTNAVQKLKLVLSFEKTTFTNREPVVCMAGLSNISDTPIIVSPSYLGWNLQLYVTNANGFKVPYSLLFRSTGPVVGGELIPPHRIGRGSFVLNDYFELLPGTYRVSGVRDIRYPLIQATLTSSVATIKVIDLPVSPPTNAPPTPPK